MLGSHRGEDPLGVSAQRDACAASMSRPPGLLSSTKAQVSVAGQTQWPFTSGTGLPGPANNVVICSEQFSRSVFGGNVTDETILSAFQGLFSA